MEWHQEVFGPMRISQEKIYKRYSFIRKVTFWTQLSIVLMLPLVGIMMYVFGDQGTLGKILMAIGAVYLGVTFFVIFVLRRCPNCLSHFPGYVFDPKKCPYCGVELRK